MAQLMNRLYAKLETIKFIAGDTQPMYVDIVDELSGIPINLSGATAVLNFMDFATRTHIWSKECTILLDSESPLYINFKQENYPWTIKWIMQEADTIDLVGDYIAQAIITDYRGIAHRPWEGRFIITNNADE